MNKRTSAITMIAMMTAIMAIFSQITIPLPFSPVPLTLQTAGVILAPILLGAKKGSFSILAYILLGVFGAPVFSAGKAGFAVLFGPTGGYLAGFLIGTLIAGYFWQSQIKKTLFKAYLTAVISILITLSSGVIWFSYIMGASLKMGLLLAVLPFLPLDILKILLFAPLAYKVRESLKIQFPYLFDEY